MNDNKRENSELKFLTTSEIAEILKMNVQVIARKLQYGEIIGYKIGKDWRVKESDLLNWLESHSNQRSRSQADIIVGRFVKDGVIKTLPAQRKKLKYILDHIVEKFELNRVYDESEVNNIIGAMHEDYCRIRREFIDERMMFRTDGKYRRNASYKIVK